MAQDDQGLARTRRQMSNPSPLHFCLLPLAAQQALGTAEAPHDRQAQIDSKLETPRPPDIWTDN
jgi:hypothetical protein